jgi:hypothetical protein
VQGLEVDHTPRNISFCGHVVALKKPLCITDTLEDDDFRDNPLVTGRPGIRSYLGWPLEIAPGMIVGTLCAIDFMPRTFEGEDCDALRDLASMAESELKLKLKAMSSIQNKILMRMSALQRRGALDPLTGCWNIRGFREMLAMAVDDACADANAGSGSAATLSTKQRIDPARSFGFRALVPAKSALALEHELAKLTYPMATVDMPNSKQHLDIPLSIRISWLDELGPHASAAQLWAHALTIPA